jgi:hypothetical protein
MTQLQMDKLKARIDHHFPVDYAGQVRVYGKQEWANLGYQGAEGAILIEEHLFYTTLNFFGTVAQFNRDNAFLMGIMPAHHHYEPKNQCVLEIFKD